MAQRRALRHDSQERQDPDDERDDADDVAVAADRCPRARQVVADARDRSERGDREHESGENERDAEDAQQVQHAEDERDDADNDLEWAERADDASAGFAAEAVIEEEQTGDDGDEGGEDGRPPVAVRVKFTRERLRCNGTGSWDVICKRAHHAPRTPQNTRDMSSHSATFRTAGFSIACLVLIYVLMVLLQSGDRRVLEGARLWLPFLVASLPPYLIILWRLGERPNDWLGLGLAVAFGTLSVVLL